MRVRHHERRSARSAGPRPVERRPNEGTESVRLAADHPDLVRARTKFHAQGQIRQVGGRIHRRGARGRSEASVRRIHQYSINPRLGPEAAAARTVNARRRGGELSCCRRNRSFASAAGLERTHRARNMASLPPLRESASAVRTLIHERAKEPKPNWIGVRGLAGEALFGASRLSRLPGSRCDWVVGLLD